MSIFDKISNIFHTVDGEIQRAYSAYDRASDILDARDKTPDFDRQKELEDQVKEAETLTLELLKNYEGVKSWTGVFREMHMNLARIYMKTGKFDEAEKECVKVEGYDPIDAEELRNALQEIMSGKMIESSKLEEVGSG
jgi:tetratricopeptide (TPR) repeat protein